MTQTLWDINLGYTQNCLLELSTLLEKYLIDSLGEFVNHYRGQISPLPLLMADCFQMGRRRTNSPVVGVHQFLTRNQVYHDTANTPWMPVYERGYCCHNTIWIPAENIRPLRQQC
jgi:hypothetical protein